MYDIIIIGGGNHHNTLGVVRALGERSLKFELLTFGSLNRHYVSSSRYVSSYKAFIAPEDVIKYLLDRHISRNGKCVLISCADIITELLNINYSLLSDRYVIPGFKIPGIAQTIMDKSVMVKKTREHGIMSPKIWRLPTDFAQVKYPCITKSCLSSLGGKDSMLIIDYPQQLQDCLAKHPETLLAQEYIHKKEEIQFIGLSLNGGDTVIIPGMTKIIRSQLNTNTGFLEYGPIDPFYSRIVDRSKSYIKDCGYSGPFSIEYIRDQNDNVYFLEVNFRNDGNAWCVTKAGINLLAIWVKACRGEEYQDEIKVPEHILMMPEFQDFKLVLQRKLSIFKWLKDWKRTDYFMEYDRSDKLTFFRYIIDKILA